MNNGRQPKPTIDAVNDAVGALSDLLRSLRAHAKKAKRDAAPSRKGIRRTTRTGKKAVQTA